MDGVLESADEVAVLKQQIALLETTVKQLTRQLDWFKQQLFGCRSEIRHLETPAGQDDLFASLPAPVADEGEENDEPIIVKRRKKARPAGTVTGSGLRFGPDVPVRTIEHLPPELTDADAAHYTIIHWHETHKLAQQPSSYVVLRHRTPIIKDLRSQEAITPPAPAEVFPGTLADVSFLAGMVVDKYQFHLPLHRQHRRLQLAGITVSRGTLSQLLQRSAQLLAPIVQAMQHSVLESQVLAMDETPCKVGHDKGRMKGGWFWPLYGDRHEVVFSWHRSRGLEPIEKLLQDFHGTLITDGHAAYRSYCARRELLHAECWAHTRRYFVRAADERSEEAAEALEQIGALYRIERDIREKNLKGERKKAWRLEHARPRVEAFFRWCKKQAEDPQLLPDDPLARAIAYARGREASLQRYLEGPDIPIDTNHVERAIRPIQLGRKNWLFCWTEMGARDTAIFQSLVTTCQLHDIHPYTYLVDVLQRVGEVPNSEVATLTPRLWKRHYAERPLRSWLERS